MEFVNSTFRKAFVDLIYIPEKYNISRNIDSLYAFYFEEKLDILVNELIVKYDLRESIENKSILLKPNWVMHPKKETDEQCLTTHSKFIIATLKAILPLKPKRIVIGDAPLQSCDWEKVVTPSFKQDINHLEVKYGIKVDIIDFRRTIWNSSLKVYKEIRPLDEYIIFNLKDRSYLDPISTNDNIFRVTNYDPDRLALSHKKGIHKYCISKEIFDADLIIQLPKIKTHQKTAITNALKNLVGINGDKDFLPHHRVGGLDSGGDCYPGSSFIRKMSEFFIDKANRNIGKWQYYSWLAGSIMLWKLMPHSRFHSLSAAWYGNDTTWRMVADLNLIAGFGKKDGSISNEPIRQVYSLCDGIIGGQGDGPLKPLPLPLGVIIFSNNSLLTDKVAATLMGFDVEKIPLLSKLSDESIMKDYLIGFNDRSCSLNELKNYSIPAIPPPGWIGHIERK